MDRELRTYQLDGRLGSSWRPPFTEALARKLQVERVLHGHSGCVNRVAWNEDGSMLASASDDLRALLWWPSDADRVPLALETQHRANLFGVQFLPHTNNTKIVTGAMDCTVQLHELDCSPSSLPPAWRQSGAGGGRGGGVNGAGAGNGAPRRHAGAAAASQVRSVQPRTTTFCCHTNRVKDVKASPGDPHLFWSASEDGTVRQFDTRLPNQKSPSSPNVLIHVGHSPLDVSNGSGGGGGPGGGGASGRVELKGLDVCAAAPHLLAVACGDPFVRLYDRRRLGPGAPARVVGTHEVLKLAPPHLPVGETA